MAERSQVFKNPNLISSSAIIKDAIAKHKCIIIMGRCRVEYQGRARSILELGERIVIIKEDRATLVHRPKGYEPVNWQPSESYFRTSLTKDSLTLNTVRRNPHESLKIFFDQIFVILAMKMFDSGRFYLHVSEKEIQKAILSEPEILEKGFKPIAYEKKINPGFLDIYGLDQASRLVVVEIKRVKAGKSAVLQLSRYVEALKTFSNRDIRGILAAPEISKGVNRMLLTLNLEYRRVDLERCAQIIKMADEKKIKDFF